MKLHLKINIFSYKAVKYGGGPDALDGRSHRVETNLKRSSTRYHLCQSGSTGSSKQECFQRICFFLQKSNFQKRIRRHYQQQMCSGPSVWCWHNSLSKVARFYPGFNELRWEKQILWLCQIHIWGNLKHTLYVSWCRNSSAHICAIVYLCHCIFVYLHICDTKHLWPCIWPQSLLWWVLEVECLVVIISK